MSDKKVTPEEFQTTVREYCSAVERLTELLKARTERRRELNKKIDDALGRIEGQDEKKVQKDRFLGLIGNNHVDCDCMACRPWTY